MYVGSLSVEIDPMDQDVRALSALPLCQCGRRPAKTPAFVSRCSNCTFGNAPCWPPHDAAQSS